MTALVDRIFLEVPVPLIGVVLLLLLWGAMQLGILLRRRRSSDPGDQEDTSTHEGYIVSGALGLMALLLGFTFALAVDRYDNRRALVLEEANDIGTTYLRAQLLDEPFRSQLSGLLATYTENRLALANAVTVEQRNAMMRQSDLLQTRLWTATVAAIRPIRGLEIASGFVEAMNATIDAGSARVAARRAHVPPRVLAETMHDLCVGSADALALACDAYLRGAMEGLLFGQLNGAGEASFCLPAEGLTAAELRQAFVASLESDPDLAPLEAGEVLLWTLQNIYPCQAYDMPDEMDAEITPA